MFQVPTCATVKVSPNGPEQLVKVTLPAVMVPRMAGLPAAEVTRLALVTLELVQVSWTPVLVVRMVVPALAVKVPPGVTVQFAGVIGAAEATPKPRTTAAAARPATSERDTSLRI